VDLFVAQEYGGVCKLMNEESRRRAWANKECESWIKKADEERERGGGADGGARLQYNVSEQISHATSWIYIEAYGNNLKIGRIVQRNWI